MKNKNKVKLLFLISLFLISISSVVFGRYVLQTENTQIVKIDIKTIEFKISDFSKYGTLDLYVDDEFKENDISSVTRKYIIGSKYELKDIKINDGYTLETSDDELSGIIQGDTNINLTFSTNIYNLTYNLNGGSIENENENYTVETETFTLPIPTKKGYTFVGWTGTDLFEITKNVRITKGSIGNREFTANWIPTNYSITYNANGGHISGQKTTYNIETASFNLVTPSRTGYSFTGWTGTGLSGATRIVTIEKGSIGNRNFTANWIDNIRPTIHGAWITSGPTYELNNSRYGYRVNIQVSVSDSGSGINRVMTYYESDGSWVGETNITGTMTDSFWLKPGYRQIRIVVYDNAGNWSETVIGVQCG